MMLLGYYGIDLLIRPNWWRNITKSLDYSRGTGVYG